MIPGGADLSTIAWTIAGPNGAATVVRSGSVTVEQSATIAFVGNAIPAGAGYSVSLSATSTDGKVVCSASGSFDVTAGSTSQVFVPLQCNPAPAGSRTTLVTGTIFNCAAVTSLNVNPTEMIVGASAMVSAKASGPVVSALTYAWATSNPAVGTLSATSLSGTGTSAAISFLCNAAGTTTLTLTVGDGPVPASSSCNPTLDTTSANITCDPAPADGGVP
jgi:hypothetical protein